LCSSGGCAHHADETRTDSPDVPGPGQPQFYNRLRTGENNDIFGV
jgi:hypothetical protein